RGVGYEAELLDAVEAVNARQKQRLFEKLSAHYDGKLEGKTVALWGLSFKPNTDDMREAPSRVLMEALWEAGATVRAYDPEAIDETRRIYPDQAGLTLCDSAPEALEGADALAILTEWQEFRSPDFDVIKDKLADAVVFDGRNLYEPSLMATFGLQYYAIGRGIVPGAPSVNYGRRKDDKPV
ncbi:MAG TPA: UDP binding domain-containing protein, partial [Vicinamibacterales bacterium]|nr:UDP binding domain-containing protein [Vicinamibacterales bacterium]